VFGVTDSFTKFTGSIGKGLSAATMDREYQERRRMNMARNKPRHALVGMAQGANYFANSLASGVTGLVVIPSLSFSILKRQYLTKKFRSLSHSDSTY
jgi:vacuolar protein sorting-associated protein 13A/C